MSYAAGDGNDIAIYAVPEPASALVTAAALGGILALRRRRPRESKAGAGGT